MGKRIEMEDGFYRERRGRLVKIPDEWVGETLHPQTRRKRASKDRSADWSGYRNRRHDYLVD